MKCFFAIPCVLGFCYLVWKLMGLYLQEKHQNQLNQKTTDRKKNINTQWSLYEYPSWRGRRVQTTCQKSNKICKKCQNCGISWPYLKSQWIMHSDKYKHAWYWVISSWNSRWNFRIVRKLKQFYSLKPRPACSMLCVHISGGPDKYLILV